MSGTLLQGSLRLAVALLIFATTELFAQSPPRFEIVLSPDVVSQPVSGRLLLLFSTRGDEEPRFHVVDRRAPQPFFGMDVDAWAPGQSVLFDEGALGYPIESLRDLPPGEYHVQAVLNRYTTFHRADGHVVQLHMDRWEGQQWNRSPGNLKSEPLAVRVEADGASSFRVELTSELPELEPPEDTEWVRHVKIRSERVSRFWGRDVEIGAAVLVPPGFDSRPEARYPAAYLQGHFASTFTRFRETPPDVDATGRRRESQESSYRFYQDWVSGKLPKMLVVLP